ncbi:glycolipid transfer protein domain-containing protein [Gorgonomyces haynaldii]|nr:glycolipid transfer protein domain-containing protein [Gorgonomyces haynaldii]
MTFFDSISRSYAQVQVNNKNINTVEFLEATEQLVKLLGELGTAFTPVKSDIQGNVDKIRARYQQVPDKSQTLQELIQAEQQEKKSTAITSLLWLKRALEFTSLSLRRSVDNPQEELSTSFNTAYKSTLSQYHSFLIRPVFSMAMSACPTRKSFYEQLAKGEHDKMMDQFKPWLSHLESQVAILVEFYKTQKLE